MKKVRSKSYTLGSCAHISTKQVSFCCRELLMHTDLGAQQKCTQGLQSQELRTANLIIILHIT